MYMDYMKMIKNAADKHGYKVKINPSEDGAFYYRNENNELVRLDNDNIDDFYNNLDGYILRKCPFCGEIHQTKIHINTLCNCGSKFYIFKSKWLHRSNGEWKND